MRLYTNQIGDFLIDDTQNFAHPGSIVSTSGSIDDDIKARKKKA